jgi:hypothetical protein
MARRATHPLTWAPLALLSACAQETPLDIGDALLSVDAGDGSIGFATGTGGSGAFPSTLPPAAGAFPSVAPTSGGGSQPTAPTAGSAPVATCPDAKMCGGLVVCPHPGVGCGSTGCEACPAAPLGGTAVCTAQGTCDFECDEGFTRVGTTCEAPSAPAPTSPLPTSTGVSPPSTPPPSSGGRCSGCMGCSVIGPFPCCRDNGTCGCTWAPGGYCL